MNKSFMFCGILLIFCLVSIGYGQTATISPEKKKIITEIITVSKAVEKKEEAIELSLREFDQMFSLFAVTMADQIKSSNQVENFDLKQRIENKRREISERFKQKLKESVNFSEFIEVNYYRLYDKYFSESELKDLLAFFKTPIGQKLNDVQPRFLDAEAQLWESYVSPKIEAIFDDLMKDIKSGGARNSLLPKPKNDRNLPPPPSPKPNE